MNNNSLSLLACLAISFFILEGCSDTPNSTGIQTIPAKDLVNVKTFDSRLSSSMTRTSSYIIDEPHLDADFITLGKANGYEADIFIRFTIFPDSVANSGTLRSAYLTLTPTRYAIGDKNAALSFDVNKITSDWSAFPVLYRSLDSISTDITLRGSFTGITQDTIPIRIPLDTSMVREWFVHTSNQEQSLIYGMLLKPSSSNTVLRSFYSSKSVGTSQPTLTILRDNNFGGTDTLLASGTVDTYVIAGPPIQTSSAFEAQGGVYHRGALWFDVSGVPPNSIINNAVVELSLNRPESQLNYRAVDSLIVQQTLDSTLRTYTAAGAIGTRLYGNDIYVFSGMSLIRTVQMWVNRPYLNQGLTIRTVNEESDLDLYALYGAASDTLHKPRIVITYTSQP